MAAQTFLDQALAHHRAGNLTAAIDAYRQALQTAPDLAAAWDGLGIALRAEGALSEAFAAAQNATRLAPDTPQVWSNLGNTRAAMGDDIDALKDYEKALSLHPAYGDAWANKGMAEQRLGQQGDAIASLSRAADLMAQNAPALNDIGNQLFALSAYEPAANCYEQAVQQAPNFLSAWNNLGNTFRQLLRLEVALNAYRKALALNPKHGEARNGYAQTLLLSGDFAAGWAAYEARFDKPGAPNRPSWPFPLWTGAPIQKKALLLTTEQGLGDTIQFLRFARRIKDLGARVLVECPPSLAELADGVSGVDQVILPGAPLPDADLQAPLMSLPYLLELSDAKELGMDGPYIALPHPPSPSRAYSKPWKIGLVWAGNPDHVNDHSRSMSLQDMTPLLKCADARFTSLQTGPAGDQISKINATITTLSPPTSFADTAAVLKTLDLVITVDTATAHLAGAMGVRCWLLLPYVPDWRWMLGSEETPWYPTMRLFRQQKRGDWQGVIEQVSNKLNDAEF